MLMQHRLRRKLTPALREKGNDTCRSPGSPPHLHGKGHQGGTPWRQTIQVGDVLESRFVGFAKNSVGNKVFRFPVIQTGGVNSHSIDHPPINQELSHLPGNARKTEMAHVTGFISTQIFFLMGPKTDPNPLGSIQWHRPGSGHGLFPTFGHLPP